MSCEPGFKLIRDWDNLTPCETKSEPKQGLIIKGQCLLISVANIACQLSKFKCMSGSLFKHHCLCQMIVEFFNSGL